MISKPKNINLGRKKNYENVLNVILESCSMAYVNVHVEYAILTELLFKTRRRHSLNVIFIVKLRLHVECRFTSTHECSINGRGQCDPIESCSQRHVDVLGKLSCQPPVCRETKPNTTW